MLQTIGLIVAVYALARLIQAPLQARNTSGGVIAIIVSIPAFAIIAFLTYALLVGADEAGKGLEEVLRDR